MTSTSTTSLPITRLHLHVRVNAPLQLPLYAGSMLRGAFGHALKKMTLLPHNDQQACAVSASCPYCQVFAPPPSPVHGLQKFTQMPAPYVIEPPQQASPRQLAAGETFTFGLVLIGKALQHLPTIVLAFERALQHGLGNAYSPCTLLSVCDQASGCIIWQASHPHCAQPLTTLPPSASLAKTCSLQLYSPLRLQYQNRPARQNNLNARSLLVALARRYQLLLDMHLGFAAPQQDFTMLSTQAETITLDASRLRWFDWERYSNRQQQSMKFGGLMGTLHLQGELTPFGQLLHLGQWLHVGKETAFGLGGYTLNT